MRVQTFVSACGWKIPTDVLQAIGCVGRHEQHCRMNIKSLKTDCIHKICKTNCSLFPLKHISTIHKVIFRENCLENIDSKYYGLHMSFQNSKLLYIHTYIRIYIYTHTHTHTEESNPNIASPFAAAICDNISR